MRCRRKNGRGVHVQRTIYAKAVDVTWNGGVICIRRQPRANEQRDGMVVMGTLPLWESIDSHSILLVVPPQKPSQRERIALRTTPGLLRALHTLKKHVEGHGPLLATRPMVRVARPDTVRQIPVQVSAHGKPLTD